MKNNTSFHAPPDEYYNKSLYPDGSTNRVNDVSLISGVDHASANSQGYTEFFSWGNDEEG